jgi:RHS repeat-associated protein
MPLPRKKPTVKANAPNRLVSVNLRDSSNNGNNWTTVYDGLGRRAQTAFQNVTNNVPTGAVTTLTYYYDPQVEFLELGLLDGTRAWKVYGPDRNGVYGGLEGCGGLEGYVDETGGSITGSVNDYFGDSVGQVTATTGGKFNAALGGYGALPGSGLVDISPEWRGRYLDWTQFCCMGARYYDPLSGRFLSADPLGNAASMSLYDYCNGDPVKGDLKLHHEPSALR